MSQPSWNGLNLDADPITGDLAAACAAAVDPLEVAARLEASGINNRAAVETYGQRDLFHLSEGVYSSMPFVAPEDPTSEIRPVTRLASLGRGLLFALPTVLFSVFLDGSWHPLSWWTLLVGLTMGWGLSQLVPAVAWTLRGRGVRTSDALLSLLALTGSAAVTAGVAVVVLVAAGGGPADVGVAAALAVYLTATSLVLVDGKEWILAVALGPPTALVAIHHLFPAEVSRGMTLWAAAAALAIVIGAALRPVFGPGYHKLGLTADEKVRAGRYLFSGTCCGLITSVVITANATSSAPAVVKGVIVWPLLLTLGVMEWLLLDFRQRGARLRDSTGDLDLFARRAQQAFGRSLLTYALVLAVFSSAAAGWLETRHDPLGISMIGAEALLGLAFFAALAMESAFRIDLVARSWAIIGGFVGLAFAAEWLVAPLTGPEAMFTCLAGCAAAAAIFANGAWKVAGSPFTY